MAEQGDRTPVDPLLLKQIRRFLYVGLEENRYFPGCWDSHKYFEITKLPALNSILTANPYCPEIIDVISQAYNAGLYSRYETIAFTMVKCLLLGNDQMKESIYLLAHEVCKTETEFFTFIFFTRKYTSGFGAGWKRAVRNWYLEQGPMELAQSIMCMKGYRGLKHSVLMRRIHISIPETKLVHNAIAKYLLHGLKKARPLFEGNNEAERVLQFIKSVEEGRHCEDAGVAARIATDNNLGLQHMPGHLLTNMEVWEACLPNLGMRALLSNLLRMHNMGFFIPSASATAVVESLLTNAEYVKKSKVTPLEVYIALCCYNQRSKPMKNPKLVIMASRTERRRQRQHRDPKTKLWVWNEPPSQAHPKELKYLGMDSPQNPQIQSALLKALELSWPQMEKSSSVRYLITMDMRDNMFLGRHFCPKTSVPKLKTPKEGTTTASRPANPSAATSATPRTNRTTPSTATNATNAATNATNAATNATNAATNATNAATNATNSVPTATNTATAETSNKRPKHPHAECFHYNCIVPGDAAIVLALSLFKREQYVTVAVFTEEGLKVVDLGSRKNVTIEQAKEKLRKEKLGRVKVEAPIEWAIKNKKQVDVFINMIDRVTRCTELDKDDREGRGFGGYYGRPPAPGKVDHCPARALERYREKQKRPHARLITMSLASHKVRTTDDSHRGILDIVGIDEHTPRVIDAFAAQLFD